jgi:hypothetical protein
MFILSTLKHYQTLHKTGVSAERILPLKLGKLLRLTCLGFTEAMTSTVTTVMDTYSFGVPFSIYTNQNEKGATFMKVNIFLLE